MVEVTARVKVRDSSGSDRRAGTSLTVTLVAMPCLKGEGEREGEREGEGAGAGEGEGED